MCKPFPLGCISRRMLERKSLIKGIELEDTASEGHENTVVIYTLSFNDVYTGKGWSAQKIGVAPFLEIKRISNEKQHPCKRVNRGTCPNWRNRQPQERRRITKAYSKI